MKIQNLLNIKNAAKHPIRTAILAALSPVLGILGVSIIAAIIILTTVLGALGGSFSSQGQGSGGAGSNINLSEQVLQYQSTVTTYAAQYGMNDYVPLILAVMMQESGGAGLDPMQASEGGYNTEYPHVPNGITDPLYSIQCGIQELHAALQLAGATGPTDMEHIKLALQIYNYGVGFYYGVKAYNWPGTKIWTQALADAYHAQSHSGDAQYVNHVLRYYSATGGSVIAGEYAWPVPGHTTLSSPFGQRDGEYHKGIDISDGNISGAQIVAAADGTVIRAATGFGPGHIGSTDGGGYGNHCYIQCANGIVMRYGHASSILVKVGDTVKRGQVIGYVGTSGSSTGPHLHFEIRQNDNPIDPMQFYQTSTGTTAKTAQNIILLNATWKGRLAA